MLALLNLIKGLPWKAIGILVCGLTIFFAGHHLGYSGEHNKFVAYQTEQKQKVAELNLKASQVTTKVVTQYVDRIKEVKVQGKTIIKKVPVYVTAEDDHACRINNGFVRVWNASNSGSTLPDTPSGIDAETSGVKLSGVASQHARESEYTRKLETQLESLQNWVREQQQMYNTGPSSKSR